MLINIWDENDRLKGLNAFFGLLFLAIDCICDAIKSDRKVYHINAMLPPTEQEDDVK